MRRYLILSLVVTLHLTSPSVSKSEPMPDPLSQTFEYILWYPSHYLSGLRQISDVKSDKYVWYTGFVALPLAFLADDYVQDVANKNLYSGCISKIGDEYGHPWGYYGAAAAVAISGIVKEQSITKTFAQLQLMGEAVFTTATITSILKDITNRERPNDRSYKSFPSGHTSGSFALAACLSEIYGNRIGFLAYLMAAFTGSTRINDNKHYLSDVVAGAIIGTVIGRGFSRQYRLELSNSNDRHTMKFSYNF